MFGRNNYFNMNKAIPFCIFMMYLDINKFEMLKNKF